MLGNTASWESITVKIKTDDFLKGLKMILEARVGPLEKRLARVEAENAALRDKVKALSGGSLAAPSVDDLVRRYETLQ